MGGIRKSTSKQVSRFTSTRVHYDRCCNPLNLEQHFKNTTLRYVSKIIIKLYPNLTRDDKVCASCRIAILKVAPKELKQQAAGTEDNYCEPTTSSSQTSKTTNSGYFEDNMVDVLRESVSEDAILTPYVPSKLVLNSLELLNNLKKIFNSDACTRIQKIQILTLLPESWTVADITNHFDANKHMINIAQKLLEEKGILATPSVKQGKRLSKEMSELAESFYLRNDTSSVMPGMKDVVIIKDKNGIKQTVQKRLLLLNLKELYSFFKEENPNVKIGFIRFSLLRPKNCILVGSSGTHSVCICPYHQNVKLLILGSSMAIVTEGEKLQIASYKDCFKIINCKIPNEKCYFGECNQCPGVKILEQFFMQLLRKKDITDVQFKQWITSPRTTIETFIKSVDEFVPYFCNKVVELLPHAFIALQQSKFSLHFSL